MSDILSKIHEDYEEYRELCLKHKESPIDIYNKDWYKHLKQLKEKDANKKC